MKAEIETVTAINEGNLWLLQKIQLCRAKVKRNGSVSLHTNILSQKITIVIVFLILAIQQNQAKLATLTLDLIQSDITDLHRSELMLMITRPMWLTPAPRQQTDRPKGPKEPQTIPRPALQTILQ